MSFTNELIPNLNKLIAEKNAMKTKLKAIGVTVPDGASLEQMIGLIPSGGGGADASVTVTAATLFNGETARDKDGNLIIGTALATTTTAGLYDVGKGKTFYNHYGTLCTGLGDFTPAEDVAAMQAKIDAFNQNLMQVTAEPEAVKNGYTAMGADGELFTGTAAPRFVTVPTTSWNTLTGSGSAINIPFGVPDADLYVVAVKADCFSSSANSSWSTVTSYHLLIPSLNVSYTGSHNGMALAAGPSVDASGVLKIYCGTSSYGKVKALGWGSAYCVKF